VPRREPKPPRILGHFDFMKLWNYLDVDKLEGHITSGLINANYHKQFNDLVLYSYGRKATYENIWDDVTEKCRGLIVNFQTGDIIARPFEKFFNINTEYRPETHFANLPLNDPDAMEKLDGSLGILYTHRGVTSIASKGSFHSEHAEWATQWYREHVGFGDWPAGYTPVFEMICESVQHHVVHYGWEGLVLLALVNIETGEELGYEDLKYYARLNGLNTPLRYDDVPAKQAVIDDRANEEGYVLSWSRLGRTPLRVKVKFPEFLRLQRIVHDATPRRIFEALVARDTESLKTWASNGPPELGKFVCAWTDKLLGEYHNMFMHISKLVTDVLTRTTTRKEAALIFTQPENRQYAPACFLMLDQRDYGSAIWKLLEPMVKDQPSFYTEALDEVAA
jgi:RNA ligase